MSDPLGKCHGLGNALASSSKVNSLGKQRATGGGYPGDDQPGDDDDDSKPDSDDGLFVPRSRASDGDDDEDVNMDEDDEARKKRGG
jgi:hypothetical protein